MRASGGLYVSLFQLFLYQFFKDAKFGLYYWPLLYPDVSCFFPIQWGLGLAFVWGEQWPLELGVNLTCRFSLKAAGLWRFVIRSKDRMHL